MSLHGIDYKIYEDSSNLGGWMKSFNSFGSKIELGTGAKPGTEEQQEISAQQLTTQFVLPGRPQLNGSQGYGIFRLGS